jgi:hypothetical protein
MLERKLSEKNSVEILHPNELSLQEHVSNIIEKQNKIKESVWDYILSIKNAHEQLGSDVFESELSKQLGMTSSTLNRWKSIGSSQIVSENKDNLPPVFSSLYEITLLEKQYKDFHGNSVGLKKVQTLINRRSINSSTETKDITHFVDEIKRKKLDKKRLEKEQFLLQKSGKVGYQRKEQYTSLREMIEKGGKVRTIVCVPPSDLLTKWSDPGFSNSDLHEEFPISETRGRSESKSINIFVVVPNHRIDVGLKILKSGGFSYRQTFYQQHQNVGFSGNKVDLVVIYGQRGMGGSSKLVQSSSSTVKGVIEISEQMGEKPYLLLFSTHESDDWLSIKEPI